MLNKKYKMSGNYGIICPQVDPFNENPPYDQLNLRSTGYYEKHASHFIHRKNGAKEDVLIYCTSGAGWIEGPHGRQQIKTGELVVLQANVEHAYGNEEGGYWQILWAHLLGKSLSDLLNCIHGFDYGMPIPIEEDGSLTRFFTTNVNELRYSEQLWNNYAHAHLNLWQILNLFAQASKPQVKDQSSLTVNAMLQYMNEHVRENPTLVDMAEVSGLSVSRFSAIFREQLKCSPMDYFIGLKIQQAQLLLHSGNMKVKEIAEELAYASPYYFSRLFSKQVGCSPKQYRKQQQ